MLKGSAPTKLHSFLVTVEMQDDVIDPERVALKLADGVGFVEGVSNISIDYFGEVLEDEDDDGFGPIEGTC